MDGRDCADCAVAKSNDFGCFAGTDITRAGDASVDDQASQVPSGYHWAARIGPAIRWARLEGQGVSPSAPN